jgi:hypothetical protein
VLPAASSGCAACVSTASLWLMLIAPRPSSIASHRTRTRGSSTP